MRNKLKSLSFSRVSEVTLGPFFRVPSLRFVHENRWCFAVAHACATKPFPLLLAGLLAARCGKHA